MNAELKPEWTAALRSGEYEQGTEALCKQGKYCCLGVLGDLLTKKPELLCRWDGGHSTNIKALVFENVYKGVAFLPAIAYDITGLTADQANVLADMNDSQAMSFAEIADWIDANL